MLGKWGIYTLEKELGRGGMAVVYAASKERPGDFKRDVCIKKILPHLNRNPEFVAMFEQEAAVAASLRHPNIVAVTDFDRVEGQLFLEMELVDGIDLNRLMRAARHLGLTVPLGFAKYVTASLLAGLAHAHGRIADGEPAPVIHRDVSPANVLVSTAGEVKLADFGIAKVRGSAVQTEVGWVKGKFSYLSPEQAKGREVDQRTDIYSAGLVLHELLTGRRFNRGQDQGGELGRALEPGDPELPWLSDEWNRLLAELLATDRDDRFAGADQALAALERIPAKEPYDRAHAGRLVERLLELGGVPGRPRPIDDAVAHHAGNDQPTEMRDEEPARSPGTPTPLAVARTAAEQPRRGDTTWLKVALAIAVAAVLFLLAREMMDQGPAGETQDPGTPAVEQQDNGIAPAAVAASPVADAGARPSSDAVDAGAEQTARQPRAAATGSGFGRLQVNCRPWAEVSVDGRAVGTTPIKDLKVRAGKRRVTLRNQELGFERTFTVKVPRGGKGSLMKDIKAAEPAANP